MDPCPADSKSSHPNSNRSLSDGWVMITRVMHSHVTRKEMLRKTFVCRIPTWTISRTPLSAEAWSLSCPLLEEEEADP
jgi:hypothetical protein